MGRTGTDKESIEELKKSFESSMGKLIRSMDNSDTINIKQNLIMIALTIAILIATIVMICKM